MKVNFVKEIFRENLNGYTIFTVEPLMKKGIEDLINSFGTITVKGIIPYFFKGYPLEIEGDIVENELSGEKTINLRKCNLSDDKNLEFKFLIMNGVDRCSAIDKLTKNKLFDVISNDMKEKFVKVDKEVKTLKELVPLGVSFNKAIKASKTFDKNEFLNSSSPYILGDDFGFSLNELDNFYIKNYQDVKPDNLERTEYIIKKVLKTESMQSTFITMQSLRRKVNRIASTKVFRNVNVSLENILGAINISDGIVKDEKGNIYLKDIYEAETNIPKELRRIKSFKVNFPITDKILEDVDIASCGKEQKEALLSFTNHSGVYLLTGGPGTGKTTTINKIIKAWKIMYPEAKFALCSPTGRAAQRMAEATGEKALTIHKLLEYVPGNECLKNKQNQLDADFVIVDESSMVDIVLFYKLICAIKSGATCLFVGDKNQLEAVGAGRVLYNLLNDTSFKKTLLNETFRQKGDNLIIPNAKKILELQTDIETSELFKVDNISVVKECKEQTLEYFKKYYDANSPLKCQILTSTHKGELGTFVLNQEAQKIVQSGKKHKSIKFGNVNFYVTDKVMLKKNNYSAIATNDPSNKRGGYYNGDIGTIKNIVDGVVTVDVDGFNFEIDKENYEDLSLAYAMTIHKSQGSEFETVIIALPKEQSCMLVNNLFYTAVTRAKVRVLIINNNFSMEQSIMTKNEDKRQTNLGDNLRKEGL